MSNAQQCPSVEQLKQLAVGLLPDPPAASFELHLLECDACAQQTAQLHQADTLLTAMKQVGQSHIERSPEEQAQLDRLITSVSGLHGRQVEATVLGNLPEPSEVISEVEAVTRELSAVWRAPESTDELGRIGGYRILKVLGAGGMGGVFLAEDMQLRRRVALKLMRPRAATAPGAAERFLREARAAAALRHDHIITIYQVGEEAGVPFLAMEYLEGESLDDRLRREPPMPTADVLQIGREIAEGLAAAHAKGLIHRDIKPANVWLESRDEGRGLRGEGEDNNSSTVFSLAPHPSPLTPAHVKLLDFGLARSNDADTHLTSSGMIVGTPSYMAPEQASGEPLDARADLFSLGVVLYRMTTGQLPFPGRNVMEILKTLVTVTPASPQLLNPAVPSKLSDLIDRLLAKDRNARPASAREVVKTLNEIVAESFHDSDSTRRTGTPARPASSLSDIATVCEEPVATFARTWETSDTRQEPHTLASVATPRSPRVRAVALAAVSAVLLLAAVLFVQTRGGTLKIEAGDGIDASVVQEQVTIRDTVSGKTYEVSVGENSMRPGQYEIVLRDPASGLKVSTERVEIQRGNSTPLRITLQADVALKTKPPREGEAPAEPRAISGVPTTIDSAGASPSRAEANERATAALTGLQIGPVHNTLHGIIPRPARLPGLARWQAVTAGSRNGFRSVAWSKQGQIIAVDGGIQLRAYDAMSLELRSLVGPLLGPLISVASDGRLMLCGSHVRRLEDDTSVRVSTLGAGVISPDGKWLAGQGEDGKLVVESVDGTEVRKFDRPAVGFGPGNFNCSVWSSDSRRLCVLDTDHTTVSILNLDGTTAASFATGHKDAVNAMSWSPDGTLLATWASSDGLRLANVTAVESKDDAKEVATGGKLKIAQVTGWLNMNASISSLAWSPDSQRLAIGTHGNVAFADRSGKEVARTVATFGGGFSLAWSPDGREVAASQNHGLVVWTADGKFARAVYRPHGQHFPNVGVEWNKAGTLAVTSDDGTVRLWESTGQPGPLLDAPGTRINMATWNPDGDKLLTSADGPNGAVARTWSAAGQPGERLPVTNGQFFHWHSDGRRVVSHLNQELEFYIHDPANEQPVVGKTLFPIVAIASQPKGNLLVVGGRGNEPIGLWHDDGTPGPKLDCTGIGGVGSVAWHPTEPIFAAYIHPTGFRIGNADGKWLEEIKIGSGTSPQVAWSPDGRWLAMTQNSAVFLRAANGQHGMVYSIPALITSLAWSPDSQSLAIGLNDHRLIVRDLFAEETKWVVQHLPPQLNAKGEVGRHGAAVVFSEAGELLHVAHSVAAKSAGPARATPEPDVATLARAWAESPANPRSGEGGYDELVARYAELDGLIYMQVETLAEPGKTQLLKPSEFVKLVGKLAQETTSPSFHTAPLDQPIDLLALADPKPQRKLVDPQMYVDVRTTVPIAIDGEYDLTFSATAPAQIDLTNPGTAFVGLGLAWRGRPCELFVDTRHAGLQRVDGKPSTQNETKVDGRLLSPNEKIEIVCQVRHDGLTILKDGEELLKWHGDPARLSAAEGQSGLGNAMPTLRCPPGWTIHAWTLTPRGKGMSPANGPVLANAKPTAVRQLLDDGYRLVVSEEGRNRDFAGDYPAHALLPANDRIASLSAEPLTSRTLQAASQLPNLETVRFVGGYLSPECVTQLNQLTQVKHLAVWNLNLRDEDLANLTLHDKLINLSLDGNPLTLTDGLLDQLAGCRSLRHLELNGNSASEESLMKLDRLVQLEELGLHKSQVTDRVLDRLQTLPNLKWLAINETPATPARVEAFRKAKPNCHVDWSEKKP